MKRTTLNVSALRPGDEAIAAIEMEIKPGFHAQSRTPIVTEFVRPIRFDLKLDTNESLSFGEPIFPPGHEEEYPQLGKLNVYTGTVVLYVPFKVNADAKPGPVAITGKLRYQICDDRACYPPESPKVEIKSEIVAPGTVVEPKETELFRNVSAASAQARSAAVSTQTPAAESPRIFGRELASNAYLLAFAGAFIVGVIFNVMPCVLPVVPLKIIGFYEVAQHNRAKSIALGAVFSLGLIASFGVLALLIVVLRVIDWGGLFTKWWFIIPMVIVLLAMAVSMFGFFTVNVPTALYNVAPRHDTYVGNFLFGVLTAALSTPCTFGMFVGLLAWALTQPAVDRRVAHYDRRRRHGVSVFRPQRIPRTRPAIPARRGVGRSRQAVHGLPAARNRGLLRQAAHPQVRQPGNRVVDHLRRRRGGRGFPARSRNESV